jgi:hypothetical protein
MLDSKVFYVSDDSQKPSTVEKFDLKAYASAYVRHTELRVAKAGVIKFKDTIEKNFPGLNIYDAETCTADKVRPSLGLDTDTFIKKRDEVLAIEKELETMVTLETINTLKPVDKVHVIVQAHTMNHKCVLEKELFDTDTNKNAVDLSTLGDALAQAYSKNSKKPVKDILKSVFYKLVGDEGDIFYGVKIKNSNFSDYDINNFLATFAGKAKREKKKVKDTNTYEFGDFVWDVKFSNYNTQVFALTQLLAVLISNVGKHVVVTEKSKEADTTK